MTKTEIKRELQTMGKTWYLLRVYHDLVDSTEDRWTLRDEATLKSDECHYNNVRPYMKDIINNEYHISLANKMAKNNLHTSAYDIKVMLLKIYCALL